jgi:elongation factor Ts
MVVYTKIIKENSMAVTTQQIKELRELTGAGIVECRNALEGAKGDIQKAQEHLKKRGIEKASKKGDRETGVGQVFTYSHQGRIGVLVEVSCETDFVARTEDFGSLGKELAMQISAMNPENVESLLAQPYIRDSKRSIEDMVKGTIAKVGENIVVKRFVRFQVGE